MNKTQLQEAIFTLKELIRTGGSASDSIVRSRKLAQHEAELAAATKAEAPKKAKKEATKKDKK